VTFHGGQFLRTCKIDAEGRAVHREFAASTLTLLNSATRAGTAESTRPQQSNVGISLPAHPQRGIPDNPDLKDFLDSEPYPKAKSIGRFMDQVWQQTNGCDFYAPRAELWFSRNRITARLPGSRSPVTKNARTAPWNACSSSSTVGRSGKYLMRSSIHSLCCSA